MLMTTDICSSAESHILLFNRAGWLEEKRRAGTFGCSGVKILGGRSKCIARTQAEAEND